MDQGSVASSVFWKKKNEFGFGKGLLGPRGWPAPALQTSQSTWPSASSSSACLLTSGSLRAVCDDVQRQGSVGQSVNWVHSRCKISLILPKFGPFSPVFPAKLSGHRGPRAPSGQDQNVTLPSESINRSLHSETVCPGLSDTKFTLETLPLLHSLSPA